MSDTRRRRVVPIQHRRCRGELCSTTNRLSLKVTRHLEGFRNGQCVRWRRGKVMNYEQTFADVVSSMKRDGRYRTFVNLERLVGEFPFARNHGAGPERVVVWCSNDYLGQGQNPVVIDALIESARRMGAGSGGTRNISGT